MLECAAGTIRLRHFSLGYLTKFSSAAGTIRLINFSLGYLTKFSSAASTIRLRNFSLGYLTKFSRTNHKHRKPILGKLEMMSDSVSGLSGSFPNLFAKNICWLNLVASLSPSDRDFSEMRRPGSKEAEEDSEPSKNAGRDWLDTQMI